MDSDLEPMRFVRRHLLIVGAGYVGLTAAGCFSALGHRVSLVEKDSAKIEMLLNGEIPIYEPGLEELLLAGLQSGSIAVYDTIEPGCYDVDAALLCVGTPPSANGDPNLSIISESAAQVAATATRDIAVVVKSTVPPGTCEALELICHEYAAPGIDISVCSNPEFLREGRSVYDFMNPDRVVVGGIGWALELVASLYPDSMPLIKMDRRGAELVKYASNSFLAVKVSFANEIAALCESLGCDVGPVLEGVGLDSRIGGSFLRPSLGWGGSCLPKDTHGMLAISESLGCESRVVGAAIEANTTARTRIVERLDRALGGLVSKRIALLGLAFKAGTDDARDSPALALAQELAAKGAFVVGYDPMARVDLRQRRCLVERAPDALRAVAGADAIVLAVDWPEFESLDPGKVASLARGNTFLDATGAMSLANWREAGFVAMGIGTGHQDRFRPIIWRPLSWTMSGAGVIEAV